MVCLVILYMMVLYILLLLKILYDAPGKTNRLVLYRSSCGVSGKTIYDSFMFLFVTDGILWC